MAEGITAQQLSQMQGGGPGGGMTQQEAQAAQNKKEQQESMRQDMLTRMMAPEAKERLNRISLVKPDKARKLEDMVLMMAQRNQLREALSDAQLKQMLEQISDSGGDDSRSKVVIDRRRRDDSDSDVDLDGL
eukprot:CAMPEP_0119091238 /NCGR_PEP_ID=MMETSP1178-20130426/155608_1 /TAXON_ID=33656 /ORGANISM="unid sp, Strain CCMP2000" /LENGTH=131 /DNA_ID=CAMNT_0007074721 /DNA_START=43 /DNA_END=438 /DNA_ORIENTATION=+